MLNGMYQTTYSAFNAGQLHLEISRSICGPEAAFIVQMLSQCLNCDVQEDVAKESETGKVYRASVADKKGHTVLVMRPANQVILKLH